MAFPITLENRIKLQKNWEAICTDLVVKHVSHKLVTRGILTQKELNDILKERTQLEQTQKLLTLLLTKDNQYFECFQACLQEDYSWLSDGLSGTVVTGEDTETFTASVLDQCSLPQPPVCFEGRSDEVEKITQLFLNGGRLAIIQGSGGQGKTALATVVGHKFVSRFGIRSVMADLKNVSTELDIVTSLLLALKLDTGLDSEHSDPEKLLTRACKEIAQFGQKILIILDNCETTVRKDTLDYFHGLLNKLNTNCKNAYVLCTSRDTIHLPNMKVHVHQLDSLSQSASLSILRWYSPTLDREEGNILGTKCGFMALLLHILGYLLKQGMKATDLVKELACSVEFYKKLFGLGPELQDVYACINLTYKRLSPKEQMACQLLSVFPSKFTAEEAFALISNEFQDITSLETQKVLRTLCNTSMLAYDKKRQEYDMHSIIQAFAQYEMSAENKERFNIHFLNFMEPSLSDLNRKDHREGVSYFERERDRFAKCIDIFSILSLSSRQNLYGKMKEFAVRLSALHRYHHAFRVYKTLLATVLEVGGIANIAESAFIYSTIGLLHMRIREIPAAIENLTKAIEIYDSLPDKCSHEQYFHSIFNLWSTYVLEHKISEACMLLENHNAKAPGDFSRFLFTMLKNATKSEEMPQDINSVLGPLFNNSIHSHSLHESFENCMHSGTRHAPTEIMVGEFDNFIGEGMQNFLVDMAQFSFPMEKSGNLNLIDQGTKIEQEIIKLDNADGAVDAIRTEVAILENILGENHKMTANSIHGLGCALSAQGKHADALSTFQRALRIFEKVSGECPETAYTLLRIGQEMINLGNADGAVDVLRKSVAMWEEMMGENHKMTAATISLLGCALSAQGKHKDALSTFQRALRIGEHVLGDSAITANTMFYLGQEMKLIGNIKEGLEMHQRALDIRRSVLRDHEDTLRSLEAVADLLDLNGKPSESADMKMEATAMKEKIARTVIEGSEYETSIKAAQRQLEDLDLGSNPGNPSAGKGCKGQHADALSEYQRLLCMQEKMSGESIGAAYTLHNIGTELLKLGDTDGAVHSLREAVALSERLLGKTSEGTLASMNNLAAALSRRGNHADALSILKRVHSLQGKMLGDSPSKANALYNMGREMYLLSDEDGAVSALREAMTIYETLGKTHEQAVATIAFLGFALAEQGEHTEALSTLQRALRMEEQLSGKSPRTAFLMFNVGQEMKLIGDIKESLKMHQRALDIQRSVLADHEDTLCSLEAVADLLDLNGKPSESADMEMEATAMTERLVAVKLEAQNIERAAIEGSENETSLKAAQRQLEDLVFGSNPGKPSGGKGGKGQHTDALSAYQRLLCMQEKLPGESIGAAYTLHDIGTELLKLGDADGAVRSLRKAVAIREKILGETYEETLVSMRELARAMSAQGNHKDALSTYNRALHVKKRVLGDSPSTATTIHSIGKEVSDPGFPKAEMEDHSEEVKSTKSIVAFGRWGEYLQVHLYDESASKTSISDDELKEMLQEYSIPQDKILIVRQTIRPQLVFFGSAPTPGSKIHRAGDSRYGTLGAYASSSDDPDNGYVLTCWHVTKGVSEFYMATDGPENTRGAEESESCSCVKGERILSIEPGYPPGSKVDLSIIKFNGIKKKQEPAIAREMTQDVQQLGRRKVFKVGATTGMTTGTIMGTKYYISDEIKETYENLVLIIPDSSCGPFAQKGDSGSIAILDDNSKLVSMVTGEISGFQYYDINHDPPELITGDPPVISSFSIYEGLEAASTKDRQWTVFDDTAYECNVKGECPKPGSSVQLELIQYYQILKHN
ncbi:uncharacterized protein LOC106167851 [Lingula anatina]|uniref:Uncharacterized protein LOC106167851 n=1 Tax=Lingula anatina TaxID=7574 RepID=A0A1S3IVH5_LINAN|nr:uncharacterized protein LOC106167851 [Lingula anatina]|eukprot:XP_013402192.1 uncharacterized protein LOC106167851 [Lingula anatina]